MLQPTRILHIYGYQLLHKDIYASYEDLLELMNWLEMRKSESYGPEGKLTEEWAIPGGRKSFYIIGHCDGESMCYFQNKIDPV